MLSFCHLLIFFKINFSKHSFRNSIRVNLKQAQSFVSLNRIQSVCKCDQQMTKVPIGEYKDTLRYFIWKQCRTRSASFLVSKTFLKKQNNLIMVSGFLVYKTFLKKQHNLGLDATKPVFGGLRTTKTQPSQSDQRLCCSVNRKYNV